ncbi:MAG: hypothetical protein EAZ09_21140 [Oscillatoriales cyanobacterium]|nr:MAG: hypothetical protein EAZ18_18100 [Oscillatoriales cyanobacterium]TAH16680.1 MAG: hypothetical protein EAZ09_21140 [Oscillatoriales cyanobacterium]
MGGLEAHPTRKSSLCGTGILPVTQDFLGGLEAHPTRESGLCGTGILPVQNLINFGLFETA